MSHTDSYHLQRFIDAQSRDYEAALGELRRGRKRTHWIWYIFPQVAGLGHSSMAQKYAIQSKREAIAYLEHGILGGRLHECAAALLAHQGTEIGEIMGSPDDLKLRSSMSLFASISAPGSVFHQVMDHFYGGGMDLKTLEFLENVR
ncbi:MAG: DUF1810 domain-containing protein [Verrucomicrobiaceae bacterium]|nr:MAG: DUF1810 domain-containing protein [Verrucomicrobiaceae bacterium]